MDQQERLLTTVKVVALALLAISAGVVIYAAASANYFSNFSFSPYSTATFNTTSYDPGSGYSLYVTADSCKIDVMPSNDNTLHATLEVSQSFFLKAYANIEVTVQESIYTFSMVTPQWIGTDAKAFVYVPESTPARIISAVTQNGELTFDSPDNISNVILETTNGNVNLQGNSLNNATLQTTNGNLYISATSFYNIIATSVNGNVESHFTDKISSGSISMTTTNGNLNFYVNPTSNLSVTASTVNGQVSISGLTYTASLFTLKQFVGTINSGGATINLSTVNGNVKLIGA